MMKILYVATRYHTNQVPVMRGWKEKGVNVKFLVQYCGAIESHDYVDLQIMRPSWLSKFLFKLFDWCFNPVKAENQKIKSFIPDFFDLYKAIKSFRPDIVIIRNYRILGVLVNMVCKLQGKKNVVVYNQYPIYGNKKEHAPFISRMMMSFAPSASFSPVFYRGAYRKREQRTELAKYFVPLICDIPPTVRSEYCPNSKIRLLDIGKYREYKNHFFIVDALSKVKHPKRFELTIIGQLSNEAERRYYSKLEQYIKKKQLEEIVHLRGHVDFNEMDSVYANHNVLLLASSEPASISVLESMSKGLCVIASVENGTTCYLDEYQCGITFSNGKIDSLINALNEIDENSTIISDLGQKAQRIAKEEFCFDRYKEALNNLLQTEFNYSIQV